MPSVPTRMPTTLSDFDYELQLAHHRGLLPGDLPVDPQPTQKLFDSALLAEMRTFDAGRVVRVEAECKKIGNR